MEKRVETILVEGQNGDTYYFTGELVAINEETKFATVQKPDGSMLRGKIQEIDPMRGYFGWDRG